jgi:lysophospholipase L1-like esterase
MVDEIICLGDSITRREDPKIITYPEILRNRLIEKGYTMPVVNLGEEGESALNAPTKVSEALGMYKDSRYFLMLFGTNDIANFTYPETIETASEKITGSLEASIGLVLDAGKVPIMLNLPPANRQLIGRINLSLRNIEHHNNKLMEMCMRRKVDSVDLYHRLQYHEHLPDGLHPNHAGAIVIAGEVYKTLLHLL